MHLLHPQQALQTLQFFNVLFERLPVCFGNVVKGVSTLWMNGWKKKKAATSGSVLHFQPVHSVRVNKYR